MKKIFTILSLTAIATMSSAQIVINEVYGGGGNSGATFKNDFIELINNGSASATITGATLQYASSAGTFNLYHALPTITLAPGQTYLIQEGAGSGGTVDLVPDLVAPIPTSFGGGTNTTPGFNMSATKFKVVLASDAVQVVNPTDANVLDFVGMASNQYEGSGAAPAATNSTSINRTNGIDTNDNAADFTTATPTPANSTLAVTDIINTSSNFVKNTFVQNEIKFGTKADVKIFSMNGQVVKSASVSENKSLEVADLAPGMYIVTGLVDGQAVSTKIVKK